MQDQFGWAGKRIEEAWIIPTLMFTNAFVVSGMPIHVEYYMNKKYLLQFIQEHKASSPAGLKLWEIDVVEKMKTRRKNV